MTAPNEQDLGNGQAPQPTDDDASGADIGALEAALAAAEGRALESKDLYIRALAELENVRKRAVRDVEQAHRFAIDGFARDLVGVKDTLELALVSGADAQVLKAGTEATIKLMTKAFEKAGVVELSPLGEPFNPELHEAMAMQPSGEHVPNTVIQVVQKGYQLNGRLLRPARVIVAREP